MNNLPIQTYESVVQQRDALEKKLADMAAEKPIGSFHISGGQVEATTDYCRDGEWPVQDGEVLVYAAPVLPKQPELIGMKVSIDTGSDNIGHRLFGEIVGTSDSNGVPVLCIEVAENTGDMAAPAQPVIPEGLIKAINRLLDNDGSRGRFSAVQSYDAREDLERLLASTAQPVSEPYKLPAEEPYGYFAFCQWNGEEFFNKREDAINLCKEAIEEYRKENAEEGCDPDEVRRVCWGIIMQHGTDIAVDDEGHIDYALTPELSTNSPVIPDGWKLVPIEPTAGMLHAFNDCDYGRKSMRERYIQMIEAAPAQEQK